MTRTTNSKIAGFTFLAYIAAGITSMVVFGRASLDRSGRAIVLENPDFERLDEADDVAAPPSVTAESTISPTWAKPTPKGSVLVGISYEKVS